MVLHILCPECSEDLAEIKPFYDAIKDKYIEKLLKEQKKPIDINNLDIKSDVIKHFDFIFNALKIKNHCCRIHILGDMDFDTLYY